MADSLSIYTELLEMDKNDDVTLTLTVTPKRGTEQNGRLVVLLAETVYAIKHAKTTKHAKIRWERQTFSQNLLVMARVLIHYDIRLEVPVSFARIFVRRLMEIGI